MSDSRPEPDHDDPLYADHLAGLRRGVLVAQRCEPWNHLQWPPREYCLTCGTSELSSAEMAPDGIVHTFTVCHRAFHPWFASQIPYAIVVGEVADGIRFVGSYGGEIERLGCGVPVTASTTWVADQPFLEWRVAS